MEFDANLQERLVNWISEAARNISEWANNEIPPFIEEYLRWKFWENAIGIGKYLGMVLFALVGYWMIIQYITKPFATALKNNKRPDGQTLSTVDKENYMFGKLVSIWAWPIVWIIVSFMFFPTQNIMNCVKVKIAPKVFLIEEAVRIVK